jgi:Flp pilus assembly protein TadG
MRLNAMFRFAEKFAALRRRMRANAIKGAVPIEFAFIAPIFFLLLMGIIETGILFYSQNILLYSTQTAGRMIRTGAAQNTAFATASKCTGSAVAGSYTSSQQWFKDQICCGISSLLTDCAGSLHVSVQNYTAGFGTSFTNSTDGSGNLQAVADTYNPGASCDVVLVRATYNWTVATPLLTWFLSNMAGGQHLLSGTTAFRNEPYVAGAVC